MDFYIQVSYVSSFEYLKKKKKSGPSYSLLDLSSRVCDLIPFLSIKTALAGFLGGSGSKQPACNAVDPVPALRLEGSPGEGTGYPLQYSRLESSMDRGARRATVRGVAKDTTESH